MSTATVNASQNTTSALPPPRGQSRLSDEQKTQVATILKDYDANNLSSENVTSIRQAFKDAKIAPGRDLRQAIENAGFSTDQLRLPTTPANSSKADTLPLQQLQALKTILESVDLSNLSSDDRQNLLSQLRDQGIARSGIFVDISA